MAYYPTIIRIDKIEKIAYDGLKIMWAKLFVILEPQCCCSKLHQTADADFFFVSIVGIDTDEIDSNAEEFEDESVEFFIKEEITEVEE